jgi:predicted metal-dependent phosphoesterase TrpH
VRDERARAIDRKLQRAGIVGAYEGVVQLAAGAPLNRPHFARFVCVAGYCSNEQQAFTRWLGRSRRADVHCEWPPLAQVVAAIRQGGGIAVLAHPEKYALTRTRQRLLVAEFGECGGDAIEVICGSQQPETTHKLARLARDHKLAASLGSDYHGPQQSWNDVGRVAALPAEVVPVWELHPGAPHSKTTARQ